MIKPNSRPARPLFSSGPCPKPPNWSTEKLANAFLGRSHRSIPGKARLNQAIVLTREVLGIPDSHRIAIVPGSDTGAFEMALWNLLGERAIEILAFESFSRDWMYDVTQALRLERVTCHEAGYGHLPDLSRVNTDNDVVFVWNGTTSGVMIPDADWIDDNRKGLTICDATSAVFAMNMPWDKLDVATFSWQKALGGEAAHGMLVLSPRAVERMESWQPPWPVPKLFRLTSNGKLDESVFEGSTLNTPSMLCVEDYLYALHWVQELGGLPAAIQRTQRNLAAISRWVSSCDLVEFLAEVPETLSPTSVCLRIIDKRFLEQTEAVQYKLCKEIASRLEDENVGFDINGYRSAPPGLRIWAGVTVETSDLEKLLPWIEWAYHEVVATQV